MALYSIVPKAEMTERFDSEFYTPDFLLNDKKLRGIKHHLLNEILSDLQLGYTGPTEKFYELNGINYLSSKNVIDGTIEITDATDTISRSAHKNELSKTAVKEGDVLITRTGTVGKSAVVTQYLGEANIAAHLIALRINPDWDSYYICSFLNSSHGRKQSKRHQRGTIIQGLSVFDIPHFVIPKYELLTQKYIGDKVRQAEQLRAWAKRLDSVLHAQIRSVFKGEPKPNKRIGKVISVRELSSLRLEAEYYGDLELWAEFEIKNSPYSYQSLGELALRIKDGPGGWGVSTNDYRATGIPVIRSVNLIDGRCELDDCVFITEEKHNDLKAHQVKTGALLLSVRGTIGRAAVFDNETYSTASLNAAVVTIDCKPTINPYYLAAFLNSEIGRIQSNRIANGAVQLNMNLKETASNLIVVPPNNVQQEVAATFVSKNRAVALANLLTCTAKTLVEALIEGQLTEQQLIQAQQALDDGDNSLDQAILSKLSNKGYAIEGATPLFNDLDELYRLLESAAQAEAEE